MDSLEGGKEGAGAHLAHRRQPGLLRSTSLQLVAAARRVRPGSGGGGGSGASRRNVLLDLAAFSLILMAGLVLATIWGALAPLSSHTTSTTSIVTLTMNLGGGGGGGSGGSGQPQPQCDLPIQDSPLATSCTRLTQACVDQERIILYGSEYQPVEDGEPPPLPGGGKLAGQSPHHDKARLPYWRAGAEKNLWGPILQSIDVRAASDREPRRYLQDPAFSTCTVPVLLYEYNGYNFGHLIREFGAQLYGALQETPWAAHIRPVMMTPFGTTVPPINRALLQPLASLKLESWAEFSSRLPDEQVPRANYTPPVEPTVGSRLPVSVEGGENRCFANLLVCTGELRPSKLFLHSYGMHIAQHYNAPQLTRSMTAQQPPPALQAGRRRQQGDSALPPLPVSVIKQLGHGMKLAEEGQDVELRIVFQKRNRDAQARQLLNAAELVEECNKWSYTAPSGATVRALCWEVETPDLLSGLAAVHQADILVGAHGANLANAFFMRPGSAAIELTPRGFENHWPHRYFQVQNAKDPDTEISFYKIVLCDPNSMTPSPLEAAALAAGVHKFNKTLDRFAIQRNLIVRWDALRTAMEAVVDTAGDMVAYRQRLQEGTWWWITSADEVVPAIKKNCGTCKWNICHKAVASGAITLPAGALPPPAEPKSEIGKHHHLNTGFGAWVEESEEFKRAGLDAIKKAKSDAAAGLSGGLGGGLGASGKPDPGAGERDEDDEWWTHEEADDDSAGDTESHTTPVKAKAAKAFAEDEDEEDTEA